MAILSRDEFFNALHDRIGDDTSDEAITFIENMTDTYTDMENRANNDGEDWHQRYIENDAAWKKKYRHRFFTGTGGNPDDEPTPDEKTAEEITVEDLFK